MRSDLPSIEVVICTFNGAAYIVEQVESVLSQTVPVQRVTIIDDCSTDATRDKIIDLIEKLPHGSPSITLHVNRRNLGYVDNFSTALERAQEDILFLCDQDDVWEQTKVEVLLKMMLSSGADLVFGDGVPIGPSGDRLPGPTVLTGYGLRPRDIEEFGGSAVWRLARRNYVNGAACAILRRSAQAALPVPPGIPHDYWLAIWCAMFGQVAASPDLLYRYRQHSGNAIGLGRGRAMWQWASIWRSPRAPRLRELAQCTEVITRLGQIASPEHLSPFALKLAWLRACVERPTRTGRLVGIISGIVRGDYRRFGQPWALVRDLASVVRGDVT